MLQQGFVVARGSPSQDVELEIGRADAGARIPGLRTHLEGCPVCREEHQSLHTWLGF
jgi:hypothetical protein